MNSELEHDTDVVIIGGGVSGLAAAHYIFENYSSGTCHHSYSSSEKTFRIAIIECRDRLGGRTHTVQANSLASITANSCEPEALLEPTTVGGSYNISTKTASSSVDIGGQWIGASQHRILHFVKKFNLTLVDQQFTPAPILTSHTINADQTPQMASSLVECAFCPITSNDPNNEIQPFIDTINKLSHEIDPEYPWKHPNADQYDSISVLDYIQTNLHCIGPQMEIELFIQTIIPFPVAQCSFLYFLFEIKSGGGFEALGDGEQGAQRWTLLGGMQQLTENLYSEITYSKTMSNVKVELHLSHQVTSVFQQVPLECFKTNESKVDHPVIVNCKCLNSQKSSKIRAKFVIYAASPTLISKLQLDFQPPLPSAKVLLSKQLNMGKCIKVILGYNTSFWSEGNNRFSIQEFYDSVIHNIFLSQVGQYPALVCLITGKHAASLSMLNEAERREKILTQISKMYSTSLTASQIQQQSQNDISDSNFATVSTANTLDTSKIIINSIAMNPVIYIEKDWCADEFSGGCYAATFPPGLITQVRDEIRRPFLNVHFAGTETAITYYGYIEGAIRAGERAAQEVLERLAVNSTGSNA